MSDASISDANPYSAPDAALDTGQQELYSPDIFSFSGRIGRLRYLAYGIGISFLLMIIMMFLMPLLGLSAMAAGEAGMSMLGIIVLGAFYIATIVFSVMFGKRRLNDLNRSGWWILLFIVPIVNLLLAIYLIFFPGTDGSNNFGAAPEANSVGVLILGWSMPVLFILGIAAAVVVPMLAGAPT